MAESLLPLEDEVPEEPTVEAEAEAETVEEPVAEVPEEPVEEEQTKDKKKRKKRKYTRRKTTVSDVTLRSLMPANLNKVGPVTGKAYNWPRAGAEVKVDPSDAEIMKRWNKQGKPCCQGNPPETGNRLMFEEV